MTLHHLFIGEREGRVSEGRSERVSEEGGGEMLTNVVQFCKVLVTDGLKVRYRLGGGGGFG